MATVKRSNWTKERHEVLKNVTGAEIDAIAARLEAEHPEEYSTPEEIMAMAEGRTEALPTVKCRKVAVMNFFKQRRRTFLLALAIGAFFVSGCGWNDDGDDMGTTMVTVPDVNYEGPLVYGGRTYKTAVIGKKVWMAENLNYLTSSGSWCYENSADSCDKYGRLYNWETAKTVCPAGWHLPTRDEWGNLAIAAGGTGTYGDSGTAGMNLKAARGWYDNGNGTDNLGFSALPGGGFTVGSFIGAGSIGFWWMAAGLGGGYAYGRIMYYNDDYAGEFYEYRVYAFSVRCLLD